ncbi:hypothetical protein COBT_001142 [Conglomerata obtusa]
MRTTTARPTIKTISKPNIILGSYENYKYQRLKIFDKFLHDTLSYSKPQYSKNHAELMYKLEKIRNEYENSTFYRSLNGNDSPNFVMDDRDDQSEKLTEESINLQTMQTNKTSNTDFEKMIEVGMENKLKTHKITDNYTLNNDDIIKGSSIETVIPNSELLNTEIFEASNTNRSMQSSNDEFEIMRNHTTMFSINNSDDFEISENVTTFNKTSINADIENDRVKQSNKLSKKINKNYINKVNSNEIDFTTLILQKRLYFSKGQKYIFDVYRKRDDDNYEYFKTLQAIHTKSNYPNLTMLANNSNFVNKIYENTDVYINKNKTLINYITGKVLILSTDPKERTQIRNRGLEYYSDCWLDLSDINNEKSLKCCQRLSYILVIDEYFPGLISMVNFFENGKHICDNNLLKKPVRQLMDETAMEEMMNEKNLQH